MESVKHIPFGTNPNGCKEAVFLALTTKHQVYKEAAALPQEYRDMYIPLLLLLNRWDGLVGFPGGNVDPGEDLKTALVREVKEELGVVVGKKDLHPVVSIEVEGGNRVTHLYQADMGFAFMKFAQSSSSGAKDYLTETTGVFLAHLMAGVGGYTGLKGIPALLSMPMPPTGREQLVYLAQTNGWVTTAEMEQALRAHVAQLGSGDRRP